MITILIIGRVIIHCMVVLFTLPLKLIDYIIF